MVLDQLQLFLEDLLDMALPYHGSLTLTLSSIQKVLATFVHKRFLCCLVNRCNHCHNNGACNSSVYVVRIMVTHFCYLSYMQILCIHILLSDVLAKEVEKSGYDRWLGKIHHFMQKDEDISACYQLQNITAHGLQFIYEGVDMNLLLSPYWAKPGDYFQYLSSISPALRFRLGTKLAVHAGVGV